MTRRLFETYFETICNQHKVKLFLNDPKVDDNNGYSRLNEVHLGKKYKNNYIYMAVAFHELGHAIINIKREKGIKKFSISSCFHEEWFAWSIGMRCYAEFTGHPFTKAMGDFVLNCLKTHSLSHYAFKDIFKDEM